MMDLSVHTIDLMEYITGMRVTEVASMNEKIAFPEPQYDVEDTSTILMRMETARSASCSPTSIFRTRRPSGALSSSARRAVCLATR